MGWDVHHRSGDHGYQHVDRRDHQGYGRREEHYDRRDNRDYRDCRPTYVSRAVHREQHRHGSHARDHDVHEIGDFVARRLLPELRRPTGQPVALVMNYGTVFLADDDHHSSAGFGYGGGGGLAGANGVLYNAPGSTMVIGAGGSPRHHSPGYRVGSGSIGGLDWAGDTYIPSSVGSYMGTYAGSGPPGLRTLCPLCGTRRSIGRGICRECEIDVALVKGQTGPRRSDYRLDEYASYPDRRMIADVPARLY